MDGDSIGVDSGPADIWDGPLVDLSPSRASDGVLECAFDSWAGTNSDGTFDGTPEGGEDASFGNGTFVGMDPSGA